MELVFFASYFLYKTSNISKKFHFSYEMRSKSLTSRQESLTIRTPNDYSNAMYNPISLKRLISNGKFVTFTFTGPE